MDGEPGRTGAIEFETCGLKLGILIRARARARARARNRNRVDKGHQKSLDEVDPGEERQEGKGKSLWFDVRSQVTFKRIRAKFAAPKRAVLGLRTT